MHPMIPRRGGRRGNAMVVGLMLVVELGAAAMAIDIGLVRVSQTQLQVAIDAAAFSAASELDGTSTGINRARTRAGTVARMNRLLGQPVLLPLSEVEVGTWDPDAQQFTLWDGVDPVVVNAVRIDYMPPQVDSVLAGVAFGIAGFDVTARALSTRPTGAGTAVTSECHLPLAIPDCWLLGLPPGANPPPLKFTFTPSPTDGIAWGDPDGNPSSTAIREQLMGQCDDDPLDIDDPMYVNEGNHTVALTAIADILNNRSAVEPTRWDGSLYGPIPSRSGTNDTANTPARSSVLPANWGNTLEGPIALVDAGSDCSAVSFTGTQDVTGIAWAVIYDVRNVGSDKNIYVQLDVVNEHEIWGEIDLAQSGNVLGTGSPTAVRY